MSVSALLLDELAGEEEEENSALLSHIYISPALKITIMRRE